MKTETRGRRRRTNAERTTLFGQIDAAGCETRVRRVSDKDRENAEEKPADDAADSASDAEGTVELADAGPGSKGQGDDGAAERVADALGVGEGDEPGAAEEPAADDEAKAPANRAARRREEATRRKRKKSGGEEMPKDKNARAKELLARRREQATERRPVQLLPGEMVEDALSRMSSGASNWIKKNFHILQWGFLVALLAGGGVLFYLSRSEKKDATSSSALAAAVAADRGKILAEDTRSEDEKELDLTKTFKTADERADTALAAYNKVIDEHGGTGAAMLAKLGQAGVLLDKKDYAHALEAYSAVVSSPLAGADPDVKGRAIEGVGFAKEGKGDLDGALASFKELEGIDAKGYKELSLYHQARVLIAKGDNDKAKELLKSAREKLQAPAAEGRAFPFLEAVVDETLRKVDPTAVPARAAFGGPKGQSMTPEEIEQLLKRARDNAQKKGGDAHDDQH
jgi:hypothetical protein